MNPHFHILDLGVPMFGKFNSRSNKIPYIFIYYDEHFAISAVGII
jgi:hypothetical protein